MDNFINLSLLKEPINWIVIWTMLLIGFFLLFFLKRGLGVAASNS